MTQKKVARLVISLLVLSLLLVACQPETVEVTRVVTETVTETVTEEVEVEVPVEVEVEVEVPVEVTRVVTEVETETVEVEVEMAALGSEDRPIKVLFVPSLEVDVIVSGGELLSQELETATGYKYEVSVPTSYAATIEAMCASPNDTIGFIPALGYVLANERCGVQVGNAAVRFGWSSYWAQIAVRDDSGIETLEDLNGKSWAVPDATSTSGFLVPSAIFADAGVVPGEQVVGLGHTGSMLAMAQGDVDFATGFFSAPLLPNFARTWNPDVDDPEIWREAGVAATRTEGGRAYIAGGPEEGGYRILDSRAAAMEAYPTIFEETHLLMISDPIPNDTVSFSSGFPLGQAQEIIQALDAYASSDACQDPPGDTMTICSDAFYGWTGLQPTTDSAFDPTRFIINALGMTEEEILGE